jgi:hypothetical protein
MRLPERLLRTISEREVTGLVLACCEREGWVAIHLRRSDGRLQAQPSAWATGVPDWLFVHPVQRRVLWLELKRPDQRPTRAQRAWLALLRAAGQEATWADGSDPDVIRRLFAPPGQPPSVLPRQHPPTQAEYAA